MGSGHWHPPMNPRETDPGPGISWCTLVSFPTSDDKGDLGVKGQVRGGEAYLWVFGRLAVRTDMQQPAASFYSRFFILPKAYPVKGSLVGVSGGRTMRGFKRNKLHVAFNIPVVAAGLLKPSSVANSAKSNASRLPEND